MLPFLEHLEVYKFIRVLKNIVECRNTIKLKCS